MAFWRNSNKYMYIALAHVVWSLVSLNLQGGLAAWGLRKANGAVPVFRMPDWDSGELTVEIMANGCLLENSILLREFCAFFYSGHQLIVLYIMKNNLLTQNLLIQMLPYKVDSKLTIMSFYQIFLDNVFLMYFYLKDN